MKKVLFVFLCLAMLPLAALEFELISFADYYGGIEPNMDYENLRARLFLRPTIQGYHNNSGLEFHLSGDFYYQPIGEPLIINPMDILQEAYLFLPLGNWDISLGQKFVSYGHSDIFSIFNRVNSQDRTLFSMDDSYNSRRSDLMLHLAYYPSFEDSIEFIYIPVPRADKERNEVVPISHSNWTIDADLTGQDYLLENMHSFYMVYSRYGSNWDIQAFYGYYTNQTADFDLSLVNEAVDESLSGEIGLEYNRIHTMGIAYTTQLGSIALSQEIGANITTDLDGTDMGVRNSDISVNTQIQGVLPGNMLSQLMIVYQHIINHPEVDSSFSSENQEFLSEQIYGFHTQPRHNIALIVGHTEKNFLRDRLKTAINVGFFFSPNILLQPKVSFAINDNLQFITGADYILGEPTDLQLRRNAANDNYYLRLEYRY